MRLNCTDEILVCIDEANARLRIVSERVDFIDNLIISVTVMTINHLPAYEYLFYLDILTDLLY